jgi:Mce-associated membrane protein
MSGVAVKTSVKTEVEDPPVSDADEQDVRESKLPQVLLTVAVALVVAAAALAGWFGVAYFQAANDDSLEYSKVRDEVRRVGVAAVVTMNTLDYRKVDEGLADWEAATTGALHDEVIKGKKSSRDAIVAAESVTEATPLSAAVSELDDRAGQASMLVALRVKVTVKGEEPKDKYMRLAAKLQRTEHGWKLYEIGQVPYLQPGQ